MKRLLIIACMLSQLAYGQQPQQKDTATKTYAFVEQMPVPQYDLPQYLAENLSYPDSAQRHNVAGKVMIRFIVNEDGSITNAEIVKKVSWDLDAEALRVVRNMPPWQPGRNNGKPVKVYFHLPVSFKLTN
jgi:periplasmic protein TonB